MYVNTYPLMETSSCWLLHLACQLSAKYWQNHDHATQSTHISTPIQSIKRWGQEYVLRFQNNSQTSKLWLEKMRVKSHRLSVHVFVHACVCLYIWVYLLKHFGVNEETYFSYIKWSSQIMSFSYAWNIFCWETDPFLWQMAFSLFVVYCHILIYWLLEW